MRGCRWCAADIFTKRLTSWFNLRCLGRGRHFRHAEQVLTALVADLRERRFDHWIFSGDATALGFEEEVARVAELLGVGQPGNPPALAVPGNHDYCTRRAEQTRAFERHFAPWQQGMRMDDSIYPFAQRASDAWLIALNSAHANRWFWDSSGRVGAEQLDRFERLLAALDEGPRILVTHYPVVPPPGRRRLITRELRDLDNVLAAAQRGGIRLWLHGHNHGAYCHAVASAPFPSICTGSVAQEGLWSYGDYTLCAGRLEVRRRVYDAECGKFRDGEGFRVEL